MKHFAHLKGDIIIFTKWSPVSFYVSPIRELTNNLNILFYLKQLLEDSCWTQICYFYYDRYYPLSLEAHQIKTPLSLLIIYEYDMLS